MLASAVYIPSTQHCAIIRDCGFYFFKALKTCAIIGDVLLLETCAYIRENTVLSVPFRHNYEVDKLVKPFV